MAEKILKHREEIPRWQVILMTESPSLISDFVVGSVGPNGGAVVENNGKKIVVEYTGIPINEPPKDQPIT